MTSSTTNLEMFPFEPVFSYEDLEPISKAYFCLSRGRFAQGMQPYYEHVLRRERADVMHVHFGNSGVEMLDTKKATGLPMVTSFYGADVSQLARDVEWRCRYARLFDVGELFLAEGQSMRRSLQELGCPDEKIRVQHLGVDITQLPFVARRPGPDGILKVLIAATFREKKGIPAALRAVEAVRNAFPQLRVTVLGDAGTKPGDEEEKERILQIVSRLGQVATWKAFLPYPEFRQELLNHHIFLSPSATARDGDSEGGAPVSLIEAQATGMPIVSTFHADIPEIVVQGESALLSPEHNPEALAANLSHLLANPVEWRGMGERGRAHVERHHDVSIQIGRLEDVYSDLL